MNPIEKVHKMITAGLVLGSKGGWIPRSEALRMKRHLINHVINGEVEINGKWVKLTEIDAKLDSEPETLSGQKSEIPEITVIPNRFPEERETESMPISSPPLPFPQHQKQEDHGIVAPAAYDTSSAKQTDHYEPAARSRPIFTPFSEPDEPTVKPASPVSPPPLPFPQHQKQEDHGIVAPAAPDTSSAKQTDHYEQTALSQSASAPCSEPDEPLAKPVSPVSPPSHDISYRTTEPPPLRFNLDEDPAPSYQNLPPQPLINTPKKEPEAADTPRKETITIRTIPLGKETSLTISESRVGGAL